jgi:hypothetical protein
VSGKLSKGKKTRKKKKWVVVKKNRKNYDNFI